RTAGSPAVDHQPARWRIVGSEQRVEYHPPLRVAVVAADGQYAVARIASNRITWPDRALVDDVAGHRASARQRACRKDGHRGSNGAVDGECASLHRGGPTVSARTGECQHTGTRLGQCTRAINDASHREQGGRSYINRATTGAERGAARRGKTCPCDRE